jgi:hypothetical protein
LGPFLLEPLQLFHGGEKRPALAVAETQVGVAPRLGGFEVHPGLGVRCVPRGILGERPVGGLNVRERGIQHAPDLGPALERLEVPGEGYKVAPIGFVFKQLYCGVGVLAAQRFIELRQPGLHDAVWCLRHDSSFRCLRWAASGFVAPPGRDPHHK